MRGMWFQAEVGGPPRLMRLPAVHGIIAPKKPWPVTDGSHVYVRKLKFCNLGACWGPLGPREPSEEPEIFGKRPNRKPVGESKTKMQKPGIEMYA